MLAALTIGLVPPLLGVAVVALHGRQRLVGTARSLALGAALAVVLAELLPAAADAVGPAALLLAAATMLVPVAAERALARWTVAGVADRAGLQARFTFGYLGVAVHQLVDGLQIGAGGPLLGLGVVAAIAIHGAPLVAAAVLASARAEGVRRATWRGLGLVLATGVGVVLGAVVPTEALAPAEPWLRAVIAGLLVHVVVHDLGVDLPTTPLGRVLDLAGFGLGVALPLTLLHGGHAHQSHAAHGHLAFGGSLWSLAVEVAPVVWAGLAVSTLVQALAGATTVDGTTSGLRLALTLSPQGPSPADTADALLGRGARPAAVVAFLVAAPLLDPAAFLVSARLLGWPFALVRFAAAVGMALVAGAVLARWPGGPVVVPADPRPLGRRLLALADANARAVSGWVALGVVLAAYVEAFVHHGDASGLAPYDAVVAGVAAAVFTVRPVAAVPLAALLCAKGMSPGAALAATLMGPAAGLSAWAAARRRWGRAATIALAVAQGAVVAAAVAWGDGFLPAQATAHADAPQVHSWTAAAAGVVLALVVVRGLWRSGPRGFLAGLVGDHDHPHAHAHEHAAVA
ncbi:MAG: permease [Alphaproteobacteria bacterium]|nr:permease [Alphaproteobacteria bacterium]